MHVRVCPSDSSVNKLIFPYAYRLDIIGRVAFGHDFKAGQSTEAKQIRASWDYHVNSGLTFGAFIAMLVIRACPSVFLIPLPAIRAGGRIREIVTKLSMRLVERGTFSERGRDILSILMTGHHKSDALTPQQIVDNVSVLLKNVYAGLS